MKRAQDVESMPPEIDRQAASSTEMSNKRLCMISQTSLHTYTNNMSPRRSFSCSPDPHNGGVCVCNCDFFSHNIVDTVYIYIIF